MRPVLTNTRVSGHASCSHQHTCSGSRNIVELLYVMSLHLLEHSILLLIIATVPFFMKKNAQEHFLKKSASFQTIKHSLAHVNQGHFRFFSEIIKSESVGLVLAAWPVRNLVHIPTVLPGVSSSWSLWPSLLLHRHGAVPSNFARLDTTCLIISTRATENIHNYFYDIIILN